MNYRVIWTSRAKQTIHTQFFIARETGRNRKQLKHAVRELGNLLLRNPQTAGESRSGNERIAMGEILSVIFEVFESELIVLVYEAKVRYPS